VGFSEVWDFPGRSICGVECANRKFSPPVRLVNLRLCTGVSAIGGILLFQQGYSRRDQQAVSTAVWLKKSRFGCVDSLESR